MTLVHGHICRYLHAQDQGMPAARFKKFPGSFHSSLIIIRCDGGKSLHLPVNADKRKGVLWVNARVSYPAAQKNPIHLIGLEHGNQFFFPLSVLPWFTYHQFVSVTVAGFLNGIRQPAEKSIIQQGHHQPDNIAFIFL